MDKNIKKYPTIEVPSTGIPKWSGGAWGFYFMYTKHHGNFILKGFQREIEAWIKVKGYTHYFYNAVFFCSNKGTLWSRPIGPARSYWGFWKESVGIFEPSKSGKKWSKYQVRRYTSSYPGSYSSRNNNADKIRLSFKRMPHRWIPEFDKL